MKISSIEYLRYEDGPGIRTTIFFQGCNRKCYNCHNKSSWDITKGKNLTVDKILNMIEQHKNPYKRVTISGGEPLLQLKELFELVIKLKEKNYDIGLYTSYEIEEVPKELLKYLNFIKVGKYIDKLKTENKFYGSSNQKFIFLKEGEIINEKRTS